MAGLLNTNQEGIYIKVKGGKIMDLKKELDEIDAFFDSISNEEFLAMMADCGVERILSTEAIREIQGMHMFNSYTPKLANDKNGEFVAYTDYSDDIKRDVAA